MYYRLITLLLILTSGLFSLIAEADTLSTNISKYDFESIGRFSSYFSEHQDTPLPLEQARQAYEQGLFTPLKGDVLNRGIGSTAQWITFTVNNDGADSVRRLVTVENPWLDLIDFYVVREQEDTVHQQTGDQFTFETRPVEHRFFVFEHDYQPGLSQVFIRLATAEPMMVPIFFSTEQQAAKHELNNGYTYGLLYGVVAALLLYNLILYLNLRLQRYFYYVIYLALFLLTNISYTGHGYMLLWPDSPLFQRWSNVIFLTIYCISGLVFSLSFLHTKMLFPRIYKFVTTSCVTIFAAAIVLIFLDMQGKAIGLGILFVTFFTSTTLMLAIISLRTGRREITYFLLASIASMAGASITAMTPWGILPYNDLTFRATEIGIVIDVILLSIALAEQFRIAQDGKLNAEKLSRIDPLTAIYNRRAFTETASSIWHGAKRHDTPLSVMLLDLDHFKNINDTYGHMHGDKVLIQTAETIQELVRDSDIVARWGGEEFIILLPETNIKQATILAERVRQKIETLPITFNSTELFFTTSIGVAENTVDTPSIEAVIDQADKYLYQAKHTGRNKVCGLAKLADAALV